jgi:uncharacterized protein (TIRG00374 family)
LKETKTQTKRKYKWIKICLGILLTGAALWLSFRKIDWEALRNAFLEANFFWVILALVNTLLVVYALGLRWQILLRPKARVPLNGLFRLNIISQYINIIIPGRFGEISKAYLVARQYPVSGGYAMGTIVIEKILDFFVFVVLWISVPAFLVLEKAVREYRIALFFCILALSLVFIFILKPQAILKLSELFSRLLPKKFRTGFQNFFEKGIEAFEQLKNTKNLLILVLLTFAFIAGQVLTNFFLFRAFHLPLSFWVGLFLLLAIQVGNIPPSVPGKLGIFEFAVILALSLFGISKSQALSYGIMLHIVAFVPKILLGLIFIAGMDLSMKKVLQRPPEQVNEGD